MVNLEFTERTTLDEERTSKLLDLIDTSSRKDRSFFRFMQVLRSLVEGQHWKHLKMSGREKEKTKVVINLAHSHVRSLLPTIFFKQPTIRCYPIVEEQQGKEKTWEAVGNNTMEKIGFTEEVEDVVFDAVVYPEGWFKWVVNRPDTGTKSEVDDRGPTVWLSKGAPVPVRLSPSQVIVDYLSSGRDPKAARFIAIRYVKTLSELRYSPLYKGKIPEDFKPAPLQGRIGPSAAVEGKRYDPLEFWNEEGEAVKTAQVDNLVTIWEVWIHQLPDIGMKKKVVTLLEGHNKPIRGPIPWDEVIGRDINQYPIERLVLNPVPDALPQSELGVQHGIQVAINWLMSRITSMVEQEKLVYGMDVSKLKNVQKARRQLQSTSPVEYIEVTEAGAFEPFAPKMVNRDFYRLVDMFTQYRDQVSGISMQRQGVSGSRTATEAGIVETGVQIKTDKKVDYVRSFLKRVCFKMLQIIKSLVRESGDTNYIFRLTGDTGAISWLRFTAEELSWMPEIEIEVDSFRKRDQNQEQQKLMLAWNMCVQAAGAGMPVRLDMMLRQVFQAFELQDADKIITSQQDQLIEQSIELAIMGMGEEMPVQPDDDHGVHIQVIDAFMNTEFYSMLTQGPNGPAVADIIARHRGAHEEALKAASSGGTSYGQGENPFEGNGVQVASEANLARSRTAQDRQAYQNVPGTGGQLGL